MVTVTAIPLAQLTVDPKEAVIGTGESIELKADPVDDRGMTSNILANPGDLEQQGVGRIETYGRREFDPDPLYFCYNKTT